MKRRDFIKLGLPFLSLPLLGKLPPAGNNKREYTVLLQQYPGAPLLVTEVVNTLGPVVGSRFSAGIYDLTLPGAFPLGKTFLPTVWHCVPGVIVVYAYRQNDNQVRIWVVDWDGNPLDDSISDMPFRIEVYP